MVKAKMVKSWALPRGRRPGGERKGERRAVSVRRPSTKQFPKDVKGYGRIKGIKKMEKVWITREWRTWNKGRGEKKKRNRI